MAASANAMMDAPVEQKTALRCFSLYADYPAGIRAKRLARQIGGFVGERCQFSSEMWKLDSVAPVGPIRTMIAQEAGESDLLMLAISSTRPEPAFNEWLTSLVPWKSNRLVPGLLVGLLGDEENYVDETNWPVQELTSFTECTGMRLVWQAAGREAVCSCDWLVGGVECLLDRKRLCAKSVAAEVF